MARKYTLEFKQEAAKLVIEKGYSQKEAAQELGISPKNMTRWIQELINSGKSRTISLSPDQEEIKRLRKENERLRMERDILKKAAAFFANEKI